MTPSPYIWQQQSIADMQHALMSQRPIVANTSDTGTGKTYQTCFTAKQLERNLVVVCPKSVIPAWEEAAQRVGVELITAINYEKLTRSAPRKREVNPDQLPLCYWERKPQVLQWLIPAGSILVFDEAHKLSGKTSQNSKLLIAAARQRIPTILLSATLCDSPLKMKALGYALGLHNLKDFKYWLLANQCIQDTFGTLTYIGGEKHMQSLRHQIGENITGVKVSALGDQFPDNQINTLALTVTKNLDDEYAKALELMIQEAETEVVASLRARQLSEYEKTPHIIELAKNSLAEGNSVAIFVNYRGTYETLLSAFPEAARIVGGQSKGDRHVHLTNFQDNSSPIIICMIQAGGVGINLHDLHGRPRVSFISPGHSAIELKQALGRIHRAGSQSPAIQNILFAENSKIEQRIRKNLTNKLNNLAALNDSDLSIMGNTSTLRLTTENKFSLKTNELQKQETKNRSFKLTNSHSYEGKQSEETTQSPKLTKSHEQKPKQSERAIDSPESLPTSSQQKINMNESPTQQTNDHAERTHAPCSPSKLKHLEICPSYESQQSDTPHPITLSGTRCHEALEVLDFSELDEEETELSLMCRDYVEGLKTKTTQLTAEPKLHTHEEKTYGFADLLVLDEPSNTAHLVDYKFGFNYQGDAETNPQGWAYTLGVFLAYPEIQSVTVHFLYPRLDEVTYNTFTRADIEKIKLRISVIVARAGNGETIPDQSNCLYCAKKSTCPAVAKLALAAAHSMDEHETTTALIDPSTIEDPEQMARVLEVLPLLERFVEDSRAFALNMRLEHGKEIPGYELNYRAGKTSISDSAGAATLAKEYGLTDEEIMACATVSNSQLATAVASKRETTRIEEALENGKKKGRGQKAKFNKAFREELVDQGYATAPEEHPFLRKVKQSAPTLTVGA